MKLSTLIPPTRRVPTWGHPAYAKDDHRIALDVEKFAQIDICNRERAGENIRLLQTVCGGGATKGGPPFKVGVRFFRCNDNYVPFDIHGNLTPFVFRDDINWRMRNISEAAQSNSKEDSSNSNVNDVSDQAKKPAAKLAFNDDINWRLGCQFLFSGIYFLGPKNHS